MAESKTRLPTETVQDEEKELKYLDFVQVAFIYTIVCLSSLYVYAKENAGPLKPRVQTVEGAVKTVVGPVYAKFHDIPLELLKFIDHKMDGLLKEMYSHVPQLLKQAPAHAMSAAQKARDVACEIQQASIVDIASHLAKTIYAKCEPAAKQLYTTYEPKAEFYVVYAWRSLNKVPLFPQVARIMVPTGVYWVEKYNQTACYVAKRGFLVVPFIPVVPVEKIAKIFEGQEGNYVVQ